MGMPLAPCSIFVGKMISAPGVLAKLFFQEGPEGPPAPPETTRPANPLRRARPDARPHRPSARPSIRVRLPAAPSRPLSAYLNFFSKQLFASRRLLFISPPHRRVAQRCDPLLGNSSTVERRTLTPLILVRIQVPQPNPIFRRNDALRRSNRDGRGNGFRKDIKGLPEGGGEFPIVPSAVRY